MDLGKVNWKPSGKNSSLHWDSWEEITMPTFTGIWKKLIPTLMMKLKGSRLQVEELIEHKVEIARELELEVEPEDITGSLQCHDKILTDEGMFLQFSSVQSLSCVQLFATLWTAACQASLSITNSRSLLKLMSIESVMPSSHLILCHPLLLLPSIFSSIKHHWTFPMSQFFTSGGQSIGVSGWRKRQFLEMKSAPC